MTLQKNITLALFPLLSSLQIASVAAQDSGSVPEHNAFIDQYCSECHNAEDWSGSLDLSFYDLANAVDDAELWEKVMRKFRGSMMPPQGNPRPSEEELDEFVGWLQGTIDTATLGSPEPGKSSLHRLNRTEYGNAVRDLLGLEVDIDEYLPADDEGYGFDNIADVLRTSPALLEQYLVASRKISELAIGDPRIDTVNTTYKAPPDRPQAQHIPGLPLGTRGGLLIEHNFPLDGEYEFNTYLVRNIVGYMTGLEWPHQLEISIDGERVFQAQVGGEEDNLMSDQNFAQAADTIDERLKVRVPVTAGHHQVAVTFIQRNAAESHEPLELHTRDLDGQNMNGLPVVDYVDIIGPYNPSGVSDTAVREQIFSCYPQSAGEESACAEEILGHLAKLAYRRPVTEDDMKQVVGFYQQGMESGGFERGIELALRFILTSPEFLFRGEEDPEGVAPGEIYAVSDLELASRLSFFLWSSVPDDELIDLAAAGQLSDDTVFEAQIERMLQDPKADALVENFASQWLFLRNLRSMYPDTRSFPNFDDKLRQAMTTETQMLLSHVFRNDLSVMELLEADYTFVNDRLAAHYGIPNIYGSHFRRVDQVDEDRRGLLGQGSILTLTSYPNRTSPVLRGKYIMENIIGAPPPPPPPDVPDLEDNQPGERTLSVRERLEQHRENPSCSGCHSVLDPLGFALENFDAIGRYRVKDEGGEVDASGELADGTPIDGIGGVQQYLLDNPELFAETMTEKMMTYALGRGLEYYDMPVVRQIADEAAEEDYRFSAIVKGIANSTAFRMKRADSEEDEDADDNLLSSTTTP